MLAYKDCGRERTVDVVADAGAVRSRVVVTKDLEALGEFADGHLRQEGEQVARATARVLADLAGRVRAGRVEVAERDGAPFRVRVAHVAEDQLAHELGAAVARLGLELGRLADRDRLGDAVHGRGRRVDKVANLVAVHDLCVVRSDINHQSKFLGLAERVSRNGSERGRRTHVEEVNGGRDVDIVVLDRDLARLADGLEGGDVNDAVDAALGLVVLEDLFNVLLDGDVAAVDVNLEGLLVLFGRVGAELALGDGRDALAGGRERVVEAADRGARRGGGTIGKFSTGQFLARGASS